VKNGMTPEIEIKTIRLSLYLFQELRLIIFIFLKKKLGEKGLGDLREMIKEARRGHYR
jgi:hypothetical protein